jgi:FdhD protein
MPPPTADTGPRDRPADGVRAVPVIRVGGAGPRPDEDRVAVEEPLEIRVGYGPFGRRMRAAVAVTMRTPGHDADLAVGYLFAEGIVTGPADVLAVEPSAAASAVRVDLRPDLPVDLGRLDRRGPVTASCGVCGKTSLDAVEWAHPGPAAGSPAVPAAVLHALPERLRAAQPAFTRTGGLHAAGLFDVAGTLLAAREDVGRHNAVDKLVGAAVRAGDVPLAGRVLLVSGRASFELVQKAAAAGVPVLAAVGAPSSLAVELAGRVGLTLVGFVRDGRFNVYTGADRVAT